MTLTLFVVGRRWPDGRISEVLAGPFVSIDAARLSLNAHRRGADRSAEPLEILELRCEAELRGVVE